MAVHDLNLTALQPMAGRVLHRGRPAARRPTVEAQGFGLQGLGIASWLIKPPGQNQTKVLGSKSSESEG